jgi:hypothetical protein
MINKGIIFSEIIHAKTRQMEIYLSSQPQSEIESTIS